MLKRYEEPDYDSLARGIRFDNGEITLKSLKFMNQAISALEKLFSEESAPG
jgi:hypothetical protein